MFAPFQKLCASIATMSLFSFGFSLAAAAQSAAPTQKTVEDLPIQYTDQGVVKAQYIKPGDVSIAEHNRLLAEAARIRMFQSQNQLPNSYTSVPYGAANTQASQSRVTSAPAPAPAPTQAQYDARLVRATMGPSIVDTTSIKAQYYVVKGDTLYSISKRHGADINAVMRANGLKDYAIRQGQTLNIPIGVQYIASTDLSVRPSNNAVKTTPRFVKTVEPVPVQLASTANPQVYAVLPGDTLYSIAQRVCSNPQALQSVNGITDPGTLQPGQRLEMPAEHCLN